MRIRHMRFACRITKATNTFRISNTTCFSTATVVNANAPECYVVRILPVLLCWHKSHMKTEIADF